MSTNRIFPGHRTDKVAGRESRMRRAVGFMVLARARKGAKEGTQSEES